MNNNKTQKIEKLPRKNRLNFSLILIGILFLYMIILCINFLGKESVSIYEVPNATVSDTTVMNGVVIRKETVVLAQASGYINYVKSEGDKLGINSMLYALDQSGNLEEKLNDSVNVDQTASTEHINKIRNQIKSFGYNFSTNHYSSLNDFKYEMKNITFDQKQSYLLDNITAFAKSNPSEVKLYSAKKPGVVSYSLDGYEGLKTKDITNDIMTMAEPTRTQLLSQNQVNEQGNVARLITDEKWSIVIPVNEKMTTTITDDSSISVRFIKDDYTLKGVLTYKNINGLACAEIKFSHDMERYMNNRILKIEICTSSYKGLKVPNSAILKKEFTKIPEGYITSGGDSSAKGVIVKTLDEKNQTIYKFTQASIYANIDNFAYVDSTTFPLGTVLQLADSSKQFTICEQGALEGVYCVNKGFCKFKFIKKTYENTQYCVVDDTQSYSLTLYDHIVLNPERLSENDFIK